jgi:beta-glucanase (GH16 family)
LGSGRQPAGGDLTACFHTYGMLWTATQVSWYLDGRLMMSATPYDSLNQPMFLLLQMWTGGWTGEPDATTPSTIETQVDWVRGQRYVQDGTLTPQDVPTGTEGGDSADAGAGMYL